MLLNLDVVDYEMATTLQRDICRARADGDVPDTLLLLEHPPVVTVGRRSGAAGNVLVTPATLRGLGIALFETERGGDVTYHGPGQLVAYPIIKLGELGLGVHEYLRALEAAIIGFLSDYGIDAARDPQYTGVWVGRDKVAAIGIAVRRGVTMHGVAVNLQPDLPAFSLIRPCGIEGRGVTSVALLLGHAVDCAQARHRLARRLGLALGLKWLPVAADELRHRIDATVQAALAP